MKIPHYKYLLTLIAGKMSDQEILKDLQAMSLQVPPIKEVLNLRNKLKAEQEDYFNGEEAVDLSWLNDLKIEAMYGYKFKKEVMTSIEDIEGCLRVINDPNMYRIITSLAMSGVTNEDIELIVNGKYDIEYSSDNLDIFLHYFFDVKDWSRFEKEQFANNVKDEQLAFFYKMALEVEKDFLMWKLGVAPDKSFDAMLRDMVVDSYYNFKEQGTRDPDQAQKWGSLMLKTQERLDKVERELNQDTDAANDLQNIFTKMLETKNILKEKTKSKKKPKEEHPDPFADINIIGKESPKIVKLEEIN